MFDGKHLQHLRRNAGFRTVEDLAEVSGVSGSVLRNVESGRKVSPSLEQTVALCTALGVGIEELVPSLQQNVEYQRALELGVIRKLLQRLTAEL